MRPVRDRARREKSVSERIFQCMSGRLSVFLHKMIMGKFNNGRRCIGDAEDGSSGLSSFSYLSFVCSPLSLIRKTNCFDEFRFDLCSVLGGFPSFMEKLFGFWFGFVFWRKSGQM